MKILFSKLCTVACLLPLSASAVPILDINPSGLLLGASGVTIAGEQYDIGFVAGTCTETYDGCDEPSDFPFASGGITVIAVDAILDQVLSGTPFLDSPERILGCDELGGLTASGHTLCSLFVPYARGGSRAHGAGIQLDDGWQSTYTVSINVDRDLHPIPRKSVLITATPTPASVPEPSTLMLLSLGVLALFELQRRRV